MEEVEMVQAKQTQQSSAERAAIGVPLGSALIEEAERWMGAQTDFLTSMEAMMTDWLRRQGKAIDTSSRSMQRIYASRNIIDLVQAQHEWVSDCLQLTASEIRAVGNEAAAITRKTAARLNEVVRDRSGGLGQQGEAMIGIAAAIPMQQAAAE
jgi:hypothetical protein